MAGFVGAGVVALHGAENGYLHGVPQDEILVIKGHVGEPTVVDCRRNRYPLPPVEYQLVVRETPEEIMTQINGGLPARAVD